MKKPMYARFRFSLEAIANFICEYLQDGKRKTDRDVLDWYDWFERRKCRKRKSYIYSLQRRPRA
jgi:hypothetical protein